MAEDERPEGDSQGRPAFAREFPRDPQLDALLKAFDAGNFAQVRAGAPRLVSTTGDDAVKRAAETLLARTRPDPLAAALLAMAALLLIALSAWWMAHDTPPQAPKPTMEIIR